MQSRALSFSRLFSLLSSPITFDFGFCLKMHSVSDTRARAAATNAIYYCTNFEKPKTTTYISIRKVFDLINLLYGVCAETFYVGTDVLQLNYIVDETTYVYIYICYHALYVLYRSQYTAHSIKKQKPPNTIRYTAF